MRVAVVSEVSAVARNPAVLRALSGRGHTLLNVGMQNELSPALTYLHTGFLAALVLNTGIADLVVGGCGTGQGFLASATQYPGVFGGLLIEPLDGWLFRQINDGNCISLALNKGYGWAAEENLRIIFDCYFGAPAGEGYPAPRRESQKESRARLQAVSAVTHRSFSEIVRELDAAIVKPVLALSGVREALAGAPGIDGELRAALDSRGEE